MTFDGKAFGLQIVESVKKHVAAVLDPIEARLKAVEARQPEKGDQGPTGDRGEPGRDGNDGAPGADGIGLADALIDKDGQLVLTMTNGQTKTLGVVVGRDGIDGRDGAKGEPGRDGFSLDDFDATLMDDGRTVILSFERGDAAFKVELGIPAMIYRGVFKEGATYVRGDTVTFGGSLWHCDEPTDTKPCDGVKSWTLAAKRGRDGKSAPVTVSGQKQPLRVGVPAKKD
jgi:hypothetical protein